MDHEGEKIKEIDNQTRLKLFYTEFHFDLQHRSYLGDETEGYTTCSPVVLP